MIARGGFTDIIDYLNDFVVIGVQLDTKACTMTLRTQTPSELQDLVISFQNKQHASKKKLQRLAGKLNWACRVEYGGRTFLQRILNTMNSLSPSGQFRLDSSFRHDIMWWANFLEVFNGI